MNVTDFIKLHRSEDVRDLALRYQKDLGKDLTYALQQIAGWQKSLIKIPSWSAIDGIIYPPHLSMEQCSSELTASYKASLMKGNSFVDLTGGLGVDFSFIARNFNSSFVVEHNAELCKLLRSNLSVLNVHGSTVVEDESVSFLEKMSPVDCVFLDPARRDHNGNKTVSISDCEPDLNSLLHVLMQKTKEVWVKYSPMLDISLTLRMLNQVDQVHVVSVDNECKELLFHITSMSCDNPRIVCANLSLKKRTDILEFYLSEEKEVSCSYAKDVELYVYEPNVSILKAGAYKFIAAKFDLKKLDVNSHLYTSNNLVADFPGRVFSVKKSFSLNKQELKSNSDLLRQANLSVRNFPLSVAQLREKLKIKEGGSIYLFATTMNQNKILIATEKCDNNLNTISRS